MECGTEWEKLLYFDERDEEAEKKLSICGLALEGGPVGRQERVKVMIRSIRYSL